MTEPMTKERLLEQADWLIKVLQYQVTTIELSESGIGEKVYEWRKAYDTLVSDPTEPQETKRIEPLDYAACDNDHEFLFLIEDKINEIIERLNKESEVADLPKDKDAITRQDDDFQYYGAPSTCPECGFKIAKSYKIGEGYIVRCLRAGCQWYEQTKEGE